MDGDHGVSGNGLCDREKKWEAMCGGVASHVHMHQSTKALLDLLRKECLSREEEQALGPLFRLVAEGLGTAGADVRETVRDAVNRGILFERPQQAIDRARSLEQALREAAPHNPLQLVIVAASLPGASYEPGRPQAQADRVEAAARAAADYFVGVVQNDDCIAVSGGETMLRVVQKIAEAKPKPGYSGLHIYPLAGEAEATQFHISANSVALRLKEACGEPNNVSALMTAPFVGPLGYPLDRAAAGAETTAAWEHVEWWRKTQMNVGGIKDVIGQSKEAVLALTGVGGREGKCALLRLAMHCGIPVEGTKDNERLPYEAKDVVGDICYRPINNNGENAWEELNRRLLGLTLEELRLMAQEQPPRRVLAIASGEHKVEPIKAAVRGGLVNGLITDELTALEILESLKWFESRPAEPAGTAGEGGARGE